MEAIYRLRYAIEPMLAAASVGHHSPKHVHELELEMLLEETRNYDPEEAWQAHYDFHAALVHPAANEWDDRILQTLWIAAERYTHLVFDPTRIEPGERQRRYDTHRLLLDIAFSGDAESIATALTEHLHANEVRIREHIRHLEAQEDPA